MSPNPTLSLYSQPFSPLSPPGSEPLFVLDGPKRVEELQTTFPPSPPASFPSTSPPPAQRSSVSSVEDFELDAFGPALAPSAADASALSGQYLARYLHYRQLALASAETEQEVDNILAAYSISPSPVASGPFASISSMDPIYQQQGYPAAQHMRHAHGHAQRQPMYNLVSALPMYNHNLPAHVHLSNLHPPGALDPLSPKMSSQRATLQSSAVPIMQAPAYSQFYDVAGQHASAGLSWTAPPFEPVGPQQGDVYSFPAMADANAIVSGHRLHLRLPGQQDSATSESTPASLIGDNHSGDASDDESSPRSSRESSSTIPNPSGGGRGYVPGATPEDPKKRHKCDVCGRGFARAFNLKSHAQTHNPSRPKPHMCPHAACKRGFSRLHDLERHRQGIHADGPLIDAKRQGITPSVARAQSRIQRRAERGNLI